MQLISISHSPYLVPAPCPGKRLILLQMLPLLVPILAMVSPDPAMALLDGLASTCCSTPGSDRCLRSNLVLWPVRLLAALLVGNLGFIPNYATAVLALLQLIHDYYGDCNRGIHLQQSPHLLAGLKGEDQGILQSPHFSLVSVKQITDYSLQNLHLRYAAITVSAGHGFQRRCCVHRTPCRHLPTGQVAQQVSCQRETIKTLQSIFNHLLLQHRSLHFIFRNAHNLMGIPRPV